MIISKACVKRAFFLLTGASVPVDNAENYRNDYWITCAFQICRIASGIRITHAQWIITHAH